MDNKKEIDIPFGAFDSELYYQEINIPNGFEATIEDNKIILKMKENEDERIRKELLEHCKNQAKPYILTGNKCPQIQSWIAWLEKQGEHAKFMDSIQICDKVTRNQDGVLVNLSQLKRVAKPAEKKGEQKVSEYDIVKTIKERIIEHFDNHLIIDKCFSIGGLKDDILKIINEVKFSKQGEQKPIDKAEPKFHEDEWITNSDYTWKIVEVKPLDYILQSQDGNIVDDTICHVDEQFHLWTIQDAKDGDVLVCESGWTCIFKALDNHTNTFSSYCFMDSDKWFCNTGSECHTLDKAFIKAYNGEIHPATKEQRDTLLKAMADAGYTFDFEKKELKKIIDEKQKSAWSEEDEKILNEVILDLEVLKNRDSGEEGKAAYQKEIDWLESLKSKNNLKHSD